MRVIYLTGLCVSKNFSQQNAHKSHDPHPACHKALCQADFDGVRGEGGIIIKDAHREVIAMLKGYADDCKTVKELRRRLEELDLHGSLSSPRYGHEMPGHEVNDKVAGLYQKCEYLRNRIARIMERVRKVERIRTELFTRGRCSEGHERMRLMLEAVYLGGMDYRDFVRLMKWSVREADDVRNNLLNFCAKCVNIR